MGAETSKENLKDSKVKRKRTLGDTTDSTKPLKKTRTESERFRPPSKNYEGLLEWSLCDKRLTARDIPQVFELLSPEVRVLSLSSNELEDKEATVLANELKTNSTLTEIDLFNNYIGDKGATVLADMLKTNSTLTSISLFKNQIGDEGATAFGDMLKTNSTLKALHLNLNLIEEEGATAIADTLKTNSTLTRIDLEENEVGEWGGEALYASVAHNDNLQDLWIDDWLIPSEFSGMSMEKIRSFTTALEHG